MYHPGAFNMLGMSQMLLRVARSGFFVKIYIYTFLSYYFFSLIEILAHRFMTYLTYLRHI